MDKTSLEEIKPVNCLILALWQKYRAIKLIYQDALIAMGVRHSLNLRLDGLRMCLKISCGLYVMI